MFPLIAGTATGTLLRFDCSNGIQAELEIAHDWPARTVISPAIAASRLCEVQQPLYIKAVYAADGNSMQPLTEELQARKELRHSSLLDVLQAMAAAYQGGVQANHLTQ